MPDQSEPPVATAAVEPDRFDPFEATIPELQLAMGTGSLTARELVEYYLTRIALYDQVGPRLNSIAALNPDALQLADALDAERVVSGARGPLHGIPILVKDNYETIGMPTTAGSVLFRDFESPNDAELVARLRAAGAIILGKTNMHEFAYGITSVGSAFGVVRNPYDPTRNPGGSSGGTGAAVAANFAAVGMGSDTCGSIRVPAAFNALVGLRGTQGLASRSGIVPLSSTQDIGGPLARTVTDLAIVLDATVGFDPDDPQTARAEGRTPTSYLDGLHPGALAGTRLGVLEDYLIQDPEDTEVVAVIGQAIAELSAAGAELVRIHMPQLQDLLASERGGFFVIAYDFKQDINAYLASHENAPVKSLADIIAAGRHTAVIDDLLRVSESMTEESTAVYLAEVVQRQKVRDAVLNVMARDGLDALVYPTMRRKPAKLHEPQDGTNCVLASNSGLPAISVPAGYTEDGLPVGLEILGRAWSEPQLLAMAYDYEQAIGHRRPPTLPASDADAETEEPQDGADDEPAADDGDHDDG